MIELLVLENGVPCLYHVLQVRLDWPWKELVSDAYRCQQCSVARACCNEGWHLAGRRACFGPSWLKTRLVETASDTQECEATAE